MDGMFTNEKRKFFHSLGWSAWVVISGRSFFMMLYLILSDHQLISSGSPCQ